MSERDRLKEEAEKLKRELAVAKRRFEKEEKLAAMQKDPRALQYVAEGAWDLRDFVLAMVRQDGDHIRYASAELLADHEIVRDGARGCSGVGTGARFEEIQEGARG